MIPLAAQKLIPFDEIFPARIPLCPRSGRLLISRGELGTCRILGRIFVPEQALEDFLRARFVPAKVQAPPVKRITASEIIRNVSKGRPGNMKGETNG